MNRMHAAVGRRDGRQHRREGRHGQAGQDDRHAPVSIGQAARDRRQPEHPEGVAADDEADRRQVVAMGGHVQRGHGHDQDHHDLHGDEGHDRHRHVRPAHDAAQRRRCRPARALGVVGANGRPARTGRAAGRPRSGSWRRRRTGSARGRGRPAAGRPIESAKAVAGATRFGPMTAPTVAPHTTVPERRCPPVGRIEVGGDVARQLVRGVAEADEHGPDEEDRQGHGDDPDGRHERPEDADPVAQGQPARRPAPDHDRRQDDRPDGRAHDHRRPGRAAPGRAARRCPGRRSSPRSPRRCGRCCRGRRPPPATTPSGGAAGRQL